mgnify:FL=1
MAQTEFTFFIPTKLVFCPDYLESLRCHVGARDYGIVTYSDAFFSDAVDQIQGVLGKAVFVATDITPNPDFSYFNALDEERRRDLAKAEALVALGGGSVIDTAKVFAAGLEDLPDIRDLLNFASQSPALHSKDIIAIPTTAGTGSEVTSWATIWDSESGRKFSLSHPDLYPKVAVLDPSLTYKLPPRITLASGLDALSHALESVWNINANPISSNYAVRASRIIIETLPSLMNNPENARLRQMMLQAAVFSGLAFSNTKTALAHNISYPVSLNHNLEHGIACSFTLPLVMRRAIGSDTVCDETLREIFGNDLHNGADQLEEFLCNLEISTDPDDYGIPATTFKKYLNDALTGERGRNFIAA